MNILHINSYFSTSGLFSQLYNRQQEDNISLKVYVPISHQFPQERLAISGDYVDCVRLFNYLDRFVFQLKHRKILKDLLQRYPFEDIDLIHAHSLFSNGWLAQQVYKKHQIPYLVAVRNADIHTFFKRMPWLRSMGIQILKDAKRIFFISKNSYDDVLNNYLPPSFKEEFIKKTSIIPNGIDEYWHQRAFYGKTNHIHQPLRIVSTGKVMGLKRFTPLARMTQQYQEKFGPVELHIIGPNWNQRIVKQLELYNHVTYHGPKNKEELIEIYRQMDIFALLSAPETFGLVYVEAMSQGLPVIYTQGQGFDGFFDNHHVGVSVQKSDSQGLMDAIEFIKKNYPVLSQKALSEIRAFKWDDIHQKYLTIYQQVLKEDSFE